MKLYSKFGADSIESPEFGVFEADADGAIEVPEALGLFLHNQSVNGEKAWEDDAERAARLVAEEHARRSDPAYLATIVEELAAAVAANNAPKRAAKKVAEPVVEEVVETPTAKKPAAKAAK